MRQTICLLRVAALAALVLLCLSLPVWATDITFTTFVSGSSISGVTGSTQVIGYTYAGNKFVGSLYPNDGRLYSTDLSGGSVQAFGVVPGAGGETVVGASLGQGGFAAGNIFAGSGANGQIFQFNNAGGAASLFTTLPCSPSCGVRSIFFDPGSTFSGNMLVTTTTGQIYRVTSGAVATQIASIGFDTEGMDVVGSTFGPFAGWLLAASEGSGQVFLISPTGTVQFVGALSGAETVAYVPLNLGSGDPTLEGFYGANFAVDIVKAGPDQFTQPFDQLGGRNLLGDAIITDEFGHGIYDIHWNGTNFDPFINIGFYPNQPEDGIFVTAERIQDVVPEPGTLAMMGAGLATLAGFFRRRLIG